MSKIDEERLYKLRHNLETELPQVIIFTDFEGTYIRVTYDGKSVCKIRTDRRTDGAGYDVIFTSEFNGKNDLVRWLPGSKSIARAIQNAISDYKKSQEVKNMANRRFIVEKMEVEQKCCEPDVINMTIRKEPDGIPFQTGRELKTLIESLDPDKLSSDYKINVNIDNDTVQKSIYMMSARGNGKTKYVTDLLKDKSVVYNGNIYNDIKDVIFNDPATIVFWVDGSKTVVKCQERETFDPEKGLAMAISKKVLGNNYSYYETFAKHVGRYNKKKFNKALEEAKKVTPDEVVYHGRTYVLKDTTTVYKED